MASRRPISPTGPIARNAAIISSSLRFSAAASWAGRIATLLSLLMVLLSIAPISASDAQTRIHIYDGPNTRPAADHSGVAGALKNPSCRTRSGIHRSARAAGSVFAEPWTPQPPLARGHASAG